MTCFPSRSLALLVTLLSAACSQDPATGGGTGGAGGTAGSGGAPTCSLKQDGTCSLMTDGCCAVVGQVIDTANQCFSTGLKTIFCGTPCGGGDAGHCYEYTAPDGTRTTFLSNTTYFTFNTAQLAAVGLSECTFVPSGTKPLSDCP